MVTFKVNDLKNMNSQLKAFSEFLRLGGAGDDDIFASRLVSCELITKDRKSTRLNSSHL